MAAGRQVPGLPAAIGLILIGLARCIAMVLLVRVALALRPLWPAVLPPPVTEASRH